jgi:hypothetical protein
MMICSGIQVARSLILQAVVKVLLKYTNEMASGGMIYDIFYDSHKFK